MEEIPEPTQMDTTHAPMDTSGNIDDDSDAANLPQGEMAGSAKTDATNVTMETDAPESSPRGQESGVKVEKSGGSPQRKGFG